MATRQGGQVQTPLEMPMWGVTDLWCLPKHTNQAVCRPKALHMHSTHGGGARALETAFWGSSTHQAVIQPSHMKPQDGWLFLCE